MKKTRVILHTVKDVTNSYKDVTNSYGGETFFGERYKSHALDKVLELMNKEENSEFRYVDYAITMEFESLVENENGSFGKRYGLSPIGNMHVYLNVYMSE